MRTLIISALAPFILISCATPGQVAQESQDKFDSMTLESVKNCTQITDDKMSNTVKFNSQDCYTYVGGILRIRSSTDYFVRAFKDKTSGSVIYQVYTQLTSSNWSYPYSASYLMPQADGKRELKQVEGDRLSAGSDVSCSQYGCTHYEHFTFPLEREYLRKLSENFDQLRAVSNSEDFRIFRKAEGDHDFIININELVGVYRLVESY